jgi:hypothetical protein
VWTTRGGLALAALALAATQARPQGATAQRAPFDGTPEALTARFPSVVRVSDIAFSAGGSPLRLLTVSASRDADVDWTTLVVARLSGLDPDEASKLSLDVAARLAERAADLPPRVAFRFVPRASPDAAPFGGAPGNARPVDEDEDGLVDEDGPDDADGDGAVTWMRLPDPAGDFAADDPAKPGAAPERADAAKGRSPAWTIVREGRDDDGDGAFNEDGPGGVDVSRNFTVGFEGHVPLAGRWAASEPESRGLLDLLLADERIAVVYELGHCETLGAHPDWGGAWSKLPDDDARLLSALREVHGKGAVEKRGPRAPGAGSLGATVWHQLGRVWLGRAPLARSAPPWPAEGSEPPAAKFTWKPVQGKGVPAGAQVLEPASPADAKPAEWWKETESIADFLLLLARDRAKVAFAKTETSGEPGVLRLGTRLVNSGRLPTHTQRGAEVRGRRPLNVRVVLPDGARLVAGRPAVQVERLAGGAETDEMRWVVAGPSGATVRFECSGPDTGTTTLEARIP